MQVLGLFFIFILFGSCLLPYALQLTKAEESLGESPYNDGEFVLIDGVQIHYRLVAPKTEDLVGKILLVHGLGASLYSFHSVIPSLVKAGYMVVAVDLPGFGYSGRPEKYDHSQVNRAAMLWQLLETIDTVDLPWTLLGHSMGGGTVAAMALSRPADTSSVVLVAGALDDFSFANSFVLKVPRLLLILNLHFQFPLSEILKYQFCADARFR